MTALQTLRQARCITRSLIVWFLLAIGAAVASPMVNPQAVQLICTGSGMMKLVIDGAEGSEDGAGQNLCPGLDCPLCASLGAPPPARRQTAEPHQPLSYALRSQPAAHLAAVTAAPPPGRGPPVLS